MTTYKKLIGLALIFFLLTLTGCQYIRLLQFKNQFQRFERYFRFNGPASSPSIHCQRPLLLPEDILILSQQTPPSEKKLLKKGQLWTYSMKKLYPPNAAREAGKDIQIQIYFNENNEVARVYYPVQLSRLFNPIAIAKALQSFGEGKVFDDGSVKADSNKLATDNVPTKDKVLANFGIPFETFVSGNVSVVKYRYELMPQSDKPDNPAVITWATIHLDSQTGRLVYFAGNIFGPALEFNLTR